MITIHLTLDEKLHPNLPEELHTIARRLRSGHGKTADGLEDIAGALAGCVCPACLGTGSLGASNQVQCPPCKGTGWKDGVDRTEPSDPVKSVDDRLIPSARTKLLNFLVDRLSGASCADLCHPCIITDIATLDCRACWHNRLTDLFSDFAGIEVDAIQPTEVEPEDSFDIEPTVFKGSVPRADL